MSDERLTSYRLRAVMRPMSGAPVNWNARATIWAGTDRRYWLRIGVGKLTKAIRTKRSRDRRYKAAHWLARCIDDRNLSTYTHAQRVVRRLLNTQADVEARDAWAETNRYWRARGRSKRNEARR